MENLSRKEIDILIDALDAWESKDLPSHIMSEIIKAMLIPKDVPQELREEIDAKEKLEQERYERDLRERKEISLILKAKLIAIKQQYAVDEANNIISEAKKQNGKAQIIDNNEGVQSI